MTSFDWFNAIQAVVMGVVAGLLWLVHQAFRGGQWSTSSLRDLRDCVHRVDALEKRMDRAGVEMSRLATDVQGMSERIRHDLRQEFTAKESAQAFAEESRKDRERLWMAIDRLRERHDR